MKSPMRNFADGAAVRNHRRAACEILVKPDPSRQAETLPRTGHSAIRWGDDRIGGRRPIAMSIVIALSNAPRLRMWAVGFQIFPRHLQQSAAPYSVAIRAMARMHRGMGRRPLKAQTPVFWQLKSSSCSGPSVIQCPAMRDAISMPAKSAQSGKFPRTAPPHYFHVISVPSPASCPCVN